MRRLGVLLATGPEEGDLPLVLALARAALSEGREVALFLMDAGVAHALDERMRSLLEAGAEATLCAMDAEAHGLSLEEAVRAGVRIGSQHDHARLVRDSDRFVAFT